MANTTPKITEAVYEVKNLPAGMSVDENGLITGTPAVSPGTYRPEVKIKTNYGTVSGQIVLVLQGTDSPVIYEQELTVYKDMDMTPYKTQGLNIYVNTGLAKINSPTTVDAPIGELMTYQITTNYIDEDKQVYSVPTAPEGMTVGEDTGLVSYNVPFDESLLNQTFQFTVGVENSSGTTTKTITASYVVPEEYKPEIDDGQEMTVYIDEDAEPYQITGRNITINAGIAVITSASSTTAELEGTMVYQITTNFVDEDKQVYSISDAPEGMEVDAETGEVVWEDIPFVTSTETPTKFKVSVENSYGTTTKQVSVIVSIPESWKPVIDEQDLTVYNGGAMTPYTVKGSNIIVNLPESWKPVIDEQSFSIELNKEMTPYTVKGSNIFVNV